MNIYIHMRGCHGYNQCKKHALHTFDITPTTTQSARRNASSGSVGYSGFFEPCTLKAMTRLKGSCWSWATARYTDWASPWWWITSLSCTFTCVFRMSHLFRKCFLETLWMDSFLFVRFPTTCRMSYILWMKQLLHGLSIMQSITNTLIYLPLFRLQVFQALLLPHLSHWQVKTGEEAQRHPIYGRCALLCT